MQLPFLRFLRYNCFAFFYPALFSTLQLVLLNISLSNSFYFCSCSPTHLLFSSTSFIPLSFPIIPSYFLQFHYFSFSYCSLFSPVQLLFHFRIKFLFSHPAFFFTYQFLIFVFILFSPHSHFFLTYSAFVILYYNVSVS